MLEGEQFVSSAEEDVEKINPDDEDPTGILKILHQGAENL